MKLGQWTSPTPIGRIEPLKPRVWVPPGLEGYQANVLAPVQVPPKWVVISDIRAYHALLEDRLWWLADLEHWMANWGAWGPSAHH